MSIIIYSAVFVLVILFFSLLKRKRVNREPLEVAEILERFISGGCSEWEWDDFTSVPIKDSVLEKIRIHCVQLHDIFPSVNRDHYTNEAGMQILRDYIVQLRKNK